MAPNVLTMDQILEADLEFTPMDLLVPSARTSADTGYMSVINGRSLTVSDSKLSQRQIEDVTLSQWYAERRASYDLNKKYGTTAVDYAIDKPKEFFSIVKNELQKVGWLISGFDKTDLGQSGGNSIPGTVTKELKKLATDAGGRIKSATDTVQQWADDAEKASSQLFTSRNIPLKKVGKQLGYATLDQDGTLKSSMAFFYFDGNVEIKNWLLFDIRNISFEFWSYLGDIKLGGTQLPDDTHNALKKKQSGSAKDIDNGPI